MTDDEYRARREAINAGPEEARVRERAILDFEWYLERDPHDELGRLSEIVVHVPAILAGVRRLRLDLEREAEINRLSDIRIGELQVAERLAEAYIRDDHVQHEEQEHLEMVCEHDCPACRELEAAEIAYRKVKG